MKHLFFFLFVAVLLTGCTKIDEQGRKNVSGKVLFDGNPVPLGTVTFTPVETKAPQGARAAGGTARIQPDGTYSLTRDLGLFEGTYSVRIQAGKLVHKKTGEEPKGGEFGSDPDSYKTEFLVPEKYSTMNSGLTAAVGTEKNQTVDFDLKK